MQPLHRYANSVFSEDLFIDFGHSLLIKKLIFIIYLDYDLKVSKRRIYNSNDTVQFYPKSHVDIPRLVLRCFHTIPFYWKFESQLRISATLQHKNSAADDQPSTSPPGSARANAHILAHESQTNVHHKPRHDT